MSPPPPPSSGGTTTSCCASSSPSRFQKLILFIFVPTALTLISIPAAIGTTAFFSCSDSRFYAQSTYKANLVDLLLILTTETATAGFRNSTVGQSPDIVYGYALCRGDLTPSQCKSCLDMAASDALRQCPERKQAAVWYDSCRLRYSDRPFFSSLTADAVDPYYYSYKEVPDRDLFKLRIGKLLRDLRGKAMDSRNPPLFAAGSINYTAGLSLYGMVQCTGDLSADNCSKCLNPPIERAVCCMASAEVTFLGGSCYVRYSTELFYDPSVAVQASTAHDAVAGEKQSTAKGKGKSYTFLIFIFCGVGILLIGLGLILRRKQKHIILGISIDKQRRGGFKDRWFMSREVTFHNQKSPETLRNGMQKFDLYTMKMATENFSDTKRLGRGAFGPTFKGELHDRVFVIKRLTGYSQVELEDLKREFRSLKLIHHPNIVKFLACHIEAEDKLLVYEYLPNTSLDRILFDPKKRVLLDWGRRYKIIEGIARGLLHLHEESGLNIVHQNLKASNILLDKSMNPKLSDFCLPKFFVGDHSPGNRRTAAAQGYTENAMNGALAAKADIFSYGVLVLEIVTGQRNRDFLGSESTANLLSYVWQYWREEKAIQVLDWNLGEMFKGHEVLRCIHVGLLCVQQNVDNRPKISTVVQMLNNYSFTLPGPSVPSITQARRPNRSERSSSRGSGSWDWKVINQNLAQLSSPSSARSDVSWDYSRGQRRS